MNNREINRRLAEIDQLIYDLQIEIDDLEEEKSKLERELDHNNGDDIIIGDSKDEN